MKVALLAGGLGTRIMEETRVRPKPMVEIGGRPILRHIMQMYAAQGFNEFAVALGYKGDVIHDYFFDGRLPDGRVEPQPAEPGWQIHLVDTGEKTMTGGRIQRMAHLLRDGTFMATYGDGVADVDVEELLRFHRSHGRIATLTAVRPPERTTRMLLSERNAVEGFEQRSSGDGWVNGGYFVFEPEVFDYLGGDEDPLESVALVNLARDGQLTAYRHHGFWQCMDTVAERDLLESMWATGDAPWAHLKQLSLT
jgi:glucose-1-phosphate cytidylyltransferase